MPLIALATGWYSYPVHNRLVSSAVKRTLLMQEVWGSIRPATVAMFLRSCVALALRQRRWAPPLVTHLGVIPRAQQRFDFDLFTLLPHMVPKANGLVSRGGHSGAVFSAAEAPLFFSTNSEKRLRRYF